MEILKKVQAWVNIKVVEKYNKAVQEDEMREILYYDGMLHGIQSLLNMFEIYMEIVPVKDGPFERKLVKCKLAFLQNE